MRRTLLAAVAVAAMAAIAGGFAWATIPASNGVITGCYQKNNGQLRVVDSAEACSSSELAIQWNQTGAQGAKGATGERGREGPTGARGPMGFEGSQGLKGDRGATGTTGDRGATGTTGGRGEIGPAGPTGASGEAPVVPPGPYQFRNSLNQLDGTFTLQIGTSDTLRLSRFAGCQPPSPRALPSNCYFTVRGLPGTLTDWLSETLDGTPGAVADLTVRGPFDPTGGVPDIQFRLDDAFVTNMSLEVDASNISAGTVDLVVAANRFHKETPTSAPACDCGNPFFANDFSFEVNGSVKQGVTRVTGVGFTVPRQGTTSYFPGSPALTSIEVAVGNGTSPSVNATRTFFKAWSDNAEQGLVDQRSGTLALLSSSLSLLAEIDFQHLQPAALFQPMLVNGAQTITLRGDAIDFHP